MAKNPVQSALDYAQLRARLSAVEAERDELQAVVAEPARAWFQAARTAEASVRAAEARVEALSEALREALDCCARSGACGEVLRAALAALPVPETQP